MPEEILSSAKVKELLKPKILSQNIVAHVLNPYDRIIIMATIDKQGLLALDTVTNTYLTVDKFTLQYVLAILNSQLASWFYYWFVYNRAVRTMPTFPPLNGRLMKWSMPSTTSRQMRLQL